VRILYVRRYSVARNDRSDRFAKDEDRKRSLKGTRADSSRKRERDERDHANRDDHEPIRVPKKREEAHVERIPVEEGQAPEEIEVRDDEVLIPVTEEEIVVERREVVKEVLRVRKDVVEDEEVVDVDVHEKDKHRDLDERARRGSNERDRRAAGSHEEDRSREARDQGRGTSFIDQAKEALSGGDTRERGREDSRTRREDESPRRRR
jgi:uncharacterized protein (TIGR02271 family)